VGFPGETDADFEATLDVARAARFSDIHVFSYSARRGTDAWSFSGTVDPRVARARRLRLEALAVEMSSEYRESLIGRDLGVVAECGDGEGWVTGTACRGVKVRFRGEIESLRRRVVAVRATSVEAGVLTGEAKGVAGRTALAMA